MMLLTFIKNKRILKKNVIPSLNLPCDQNIIEIGKISHQNQIVIQKMNDIVDNIIGKVEELFLKDNENSFLRSEQNVMKIGQSSQLNQIVTAKKNQIIDNN